MARGPHRAAMPRASAPAGRHLGKRADEGPGQKAASCFGPQWRKWQQQTTTGRPTAVRRARTARLALQNGPGRAAKRHGQRQGPCRIDRGAPAAKQARRNRPPAGGGMPAAPCALLPTVQGRAQRACAPSAPSAGPAAGLGSSSERYFRLSASMRSASTSCLSWARACCMAPP